MQEKLPGLGDWAIIRTGGKQARVSVGELIEVARSDFFAAAAEGPRHLFSFDRVLGIKTGDQVLIGNPTVAGARVIGEILPEKRTPKVLAFKKRRRKNSKKRRGHRQTLQPVRVVAIELDEPARTSPKVLLPSAFAIPPPQDTVTAQPELLNTLEMLDSNDREQIVGALARVLCTDWADRPRWERNEIAGVVEPLLTFDGIGRGAELHLPAALALHSVVFGARHDKKPNIALAVNELRRYFETRRRLFFLQTRLSKPEPATGHYNRFSLRITLWRVLDLGVPGAQIELTQRAHRMPPPLYKVSGLGVQPGSVVRVARGEVPPTMLAETVVHFMNNSLVSRFAIFDLRIGERRIERRFLDLAELAVSRHSPQQLDHEATV